MTASIVPTEFIAASSASASPSAYSEHESKEASAVKSAYREPLDVEGIQDALGRLYHPMVFPSDHFLPSLECRATWSIICKDELNRKGLQPRSPEKKCAQGGILTTLRVSPATCNLLTLFEPSTDTTWFSCCKSEYIQGNSPGINPNDKRAEWWALHVSAFQCKCHKWFRFHVVLQVLDGAHQ